MLATNQLLIINLIILALFRRSVQRVCEAHLRAQATQPLSKCRSGGNTVFDLNLISLGPKTNGLLLYL